MHVTHCFLNRAIFCLIENDLQSYTILVNSINENVVLYTVQRSTEIMFAVWCVSLLLSFAVQVKCAKILGIFHIPSVSHQVVFQPIWRELSLRGHEVTIMSPNTLKDPSLTNLTEVDLSSLYGGLGDLLTKIAKGMDHWEWTEEVEAYSKVNVQQVFGHSEVQAFIKDNSRHFDVVLTEAIYPAPAVFAYKFRCPWIGIASLDVVDPLHQLVGTPTHPVLYPELSTTFGEELSFFERLDAVLFYWYRRYLFFYDTVPSLNKEIKRYFGNDAPDLIELCKNMSMLFLNTNPIIHKPRPFGPNVVQMGGRMHLKPKKPLPLVTHSHINILGCIVCFFCRNLKSIWTILRKVLYILA